MVEVLAFFGACALISAALWLLPSTGRGRDGARAVYRDSQVPLFVRSMVVLAPIWAVGSGMMAIAVLMPRSIGLWLVVAALVIVQAAFALSYRPPRRFLPGWLRAEIDAGKTQAPLPGAGDFVLLMVVLVGGVIGDLALVALGLHLV